jgi:class 3 adenylate cyclase
MDDPGLAVEAVTDDLTIAREALARHAWQEAFESFTRAEVRSGLGGSDLEGLAEAAWFSGRADLAIDARERAFKAHQSAGDRVRAAYVALDLAREHAFKRQGSLASAWTRRAERLLDGEPESNAHGYLEIIRAQAAQGADPDTARTHADKAFEIGVRVGDDDLQALALVLRGMLAIAAGAVDEGFGLMEEAGIAAVNGELSPYATGVTFCTVISACRDLTDYQRAGEWLEATEKWCQRESIGGFPGVCRIHRAEVVAFSGAWEQAREQLEQATIELINYNATPPLADGYYALGELRLRQGDLAGAEAALREAEGLGRSPQPALALVRLAEGRTRTAVTAIDAALEETADVWARSRLLPAKTEIAIAAGDVGSARAALDAFGDLIEVHPTPALTARRRDLAARVLLAEGTAAEAVREARAAIRDWQGLGAPYEVARTRAILGASLLSAGDGDGEAELATAAEEFARLGASVDRASVEGELGRLSASRAAPLQARRTLMFTDIVGSTTLAEALGDKAWERLLEWHDQALRARFAGHRGEVVNSTGDGFFVAFEAPPAAIECAIAIQRALADHRRTSGFAPDVRIGIHTADVVRRGADYTGTGVNIAARVAAIANGGEIVVTTTTLGEAGDAPTSATRTVELKGVSGTVEVATIAW